MEAAERTVPELLGIFQFVGDLKFHAEAGGGTASDSITAIKACWLRWYNYVGVGSFGFLSMLCSLPE